MSSPHSQSQYQVRFDWGIEGARTIAEDADVIVVVDVLSFTTAVDLAVADGRDVDTRGADGSPVSAALAEHPADVVAGSLRNASAVARWALERQGDKGDRFTVAVIACGDTRADGSTRFALEDLLGAGAIIDALATAGIDYCSPESAAAAASFTGLRNATGALILASTGGREWAENGGSAEARLAIAIDSSTTVPLLREFSFHA